MRISEWSSDVCSSDLPPRASAKEDGFCRSRQNIARPSSRPTYRRDAPSQVQGYPLRRACRPPVRLGCSPRYSASWPHDPAGPSRSNMPLKARSEEHTSELQSLMRISYAVFCLKKKNNTIRYTKDSRQQQKYPNTHSTVLKEDEKNKQYTQHEH